VRYVACWKCRTQKIAKNSGCIFTTKACIDNRKKNKLLNSNTSPICPHNMMIFGPLAVEICWRVWDTPSKFQRVSRLGSITAWHSSSGRQPKFAALNKERHLHSAGRPSRWALVHILVLYNICSSCSNISSFDKVSEY